MIPQYPFGLPHRSRATHFADSFGCRVAHPITAVDPFAAVSAGGVFADAGAPGFFIRSL